MPRTAGASRRVGIVLSRFNPEIGDGLLASALRGLADAGVKDSNIVIASVPGALEAPLVLQRMAQAGEFDALVAIGAVIRGETYHFEIVANESARGVGEVALQFGIPIGSATVAIAAGAWVPLHNCASGFDERSGGFDVVTGAAKDIVYE